MSTEGAVVVVGGTRAIGHEIVRHYVDRGETVVLTGHHQTLDRGTGTRGPRPQPLRSRREPVERAPDTVLIVLERQRRWHDDSNEREPGSPVA